MINREIIYERNLTGSFMKIAAPVDAGLDEELMLQRKLPGLLPVEKAYIDGCGQYWYNISGRQSLDTYCRVKDIGIAFIERLIISICSEMEVLEWNLIQADCLVLDPELVFITNCNQEIIFTVYPGGNGTVETEFRQLMEYLLTKVDHKDEQAVRTAYAIYEKTLQEGYSIRDIREEILQKKQQAAQKEAFLQQEERAPLPQENDGERSRRNARRTAEPTPQDGQNPVKERRAERKEPKKKEPKKREKQRQGSQKEEAGWVRKLRSFLADLGILEAAEAAGRKEPEERLKRQPETVVYPDEEIEMPVQPQYHPTVCLSGTAKPRGMLLYQGAGQFEDIRIDAASLCIGYGAQANVQICHDTISQMHARLSREQDDFYIEDLNSTNGTYVNEQPLAYKERRRLNSNDIICFADIRYRFC